MLLNIFLIAMAIALLVYRYRKLMYHFRTVEAGKLYRSGTLGPIALRVIDRVLGVNTIINLNRHQFARHLSAIQNGNQRGIHEQQTLSRRIQD
jgi:hypothetical protein